MVLMVVAVMVDGVVVFFTPSMRCVTMEVAMLAYQAQTHTRAHTFIETKNEREAAVLLPSKAFSSKVRNFHFIEIQQQQQQWCCWVVVKNSCHHIFGCTRSLTYTRTHTYTRAPHKYTNSCTHTCTHSHGARAISAASIYLLS